ncbi:hypothetical protein [Chloroflexus aggregans]|uniref:hypothetical protein n=1 Tax=Chloroflexus aggregans TaxID=152260 RepID=UPI0012ED0727|nr:hypothetical protein [Chloroflexus aggregans]
MRRAAKRRCGTRWCAGTSPAGSGPIYGEGGAQVAVESATVAGNANGGIGTSYAMATVVNSSVWGNGEWTLGG